MPRDPDDDLELPALDGDLADEELEAEHDDIEIAEDGGDALDDATAGDAIDHGLVFGGDAAGEGGLLVGAEDAATLDVGAFDLSVGAEDVDLLDDHADPSDPSDEDVGLGDETVVADGGEEGPLAEDEELREEDLPALDADDDGDVADEDLYERTMLAEQDELRWDDRAWERLDDKLDVAEEIDESGTLAVPGEEPAHRARDATWKRLEEGGRLMAATLLPGGPVIVAIATPDWARALLVRIVMDGSARIIAEIDPSVSSTSDDESSCKVTYLRWEAAANRLVTAGTFGACAFRPV